jgi:Mg2+/Co2+ transporter CorC
VGHFDRSAQPKPRAPKPFIPERLKRLDNELHETRERDFDYVYATRGTHRIKICIARVKQPDSPDYQFVSTASVGGKVHRAFGHVPSHAISRILKQLDWAVSKLDNERLAIACGYMAA